MSGMACLRGFTVLPWIHSDKQRTTGHKLDVSSFENETAIESSNRDIYINQILFRKKICAQKI